MSKKKPAQTSWSTPNTKVAAAFNALGFPLDITVTESVIGNNATGQVSVELMLYGPSITQPGLALPHLAKAYERGQLPATHPLSIGISACNAYDQILAMKRGERYRLELTADQSLTCYVRGEPDPVQQLAAEVAETDDLSLACALSVVGFPVINILGAGKRCLFRLPRWSLPLKTESGFQSLDIATLITRAEPGKLPLLLEQTQPHHPLVIAYQARHIHSQIIARMNEKKRRLLLSHPQHTARYGIVSDTPSNRVMDEMRQHFKLPR